ncbi:hypothetical protein Ndes2526A_g04979 [Nannochloris sp. 'desiccata']
MTVSDPISSATLLQQRVLKKLKLGFELEDETQWKSFLDSDYRAALNEFLNSTAACSLLFYLQGTQLCASVRPGARPPGRCVFFLKPTPESLSPENFDCIVASGEFTGENLPCMSSILDKNETTGTFDDAPTILPLPTAVDFSCLETKIEEGEEGGITLDSSTLVHLESAVSSWVSIVDVSLSRRINDAEKETARSAKQGGEFNLSSKAIAAALSWKTRAVALETLNKELQHRSITVITQALLKTGSSVAPSFLQSCYNVGAAAEEARSIAIALAPLLPLFQRLYTSENLINASDAVTLCMHGIFLTWQYCDALRSSSIALSLMVQAMANDVVNVAQRCVYGRELLQGDLNEASGVSRGMLRILGHMKSCYADARDKASNLATRGEESTSFPTAHGTFRAIDALMARCQDIHTVCTTSNQYSKLEKIDFGGPEGGAFTATARHLYSEFVIIQEKVISQGSGTVDPFDLTNSTFPTAMLGWKYGVQQLDARLSVFITRVLETAPTFDGCCKIIESLEALCDRPIARRCIETVQMKAVKTFTHEVRAVEEVFECEKAAPPVALGTPPCAGAVAWVRGLQERLTVPMARLRNLSQSILQSETGREMIRVYDSALRMLRSHEDGVMAAWCETSAGISDATMKQPVLRVLQTLVSPPNTSDTLHLTQTSTVQVNFNPALSQLLKEVRALTAMSGLSRPIPAAALAFFQQEAVLLQHISALQQLAAELNAVRSSLSAVEVPLVASALAAAENIAAKGQREVTWASKELDSFCSTASQCGIELAKQVKLLREVVVATEVDTQQWQKDFPLSFSANDSANNINSFASLKRSAVSGASYTISKSLQSFVDLNTWLEAAATHRKCAVDEGSQRLHSRLESAAEQLGLVPTSPSWVEYSRYVSTIAQKGCIDAVIVSLEALTRLLIVEQGEKGFPMAPLLIVALHLASGKEGLQWHQIELEETFAVRDGLAAVRSAFATSVARCESVASQIFIFQHEVASTCTAAAATLSNNTSGEDGALEKQVLEEIETEIHRLRTLQDSIHQIPSVQTPVGWISMDFEPAKQALATAAGKHVALLTGKIRHSVERKLDSTMEFISKAIDTIQSASTMVQIKERGPTVLGSSSAASRRATTKVAPTAGQRSSLMGRASIFSSSSKLSSRASVLSGAGSTGSRRSSTASLAAASMAVDSQQLYSLLRCFKEITQRVSNSDAELGPLLAASAMLQRCEAPLSEETESTLRQCPQAWRSLTRKASAAKEALSPVITAEVADVKKLYSQLNHESEEFRVYFQKIAPFGPPGGKELTAAEVEQAVAALDTLQLRTNSGSNVSINLHDLSSRSDSLRERLQLLDILSSSQPSSCSGATSSADRTVSSSSSLQRCQEEAHALRLLWDEISTTLNIFSSWDALPWPQVDAEALGEECKRKNKDLKSLPRSVREYNSYKILESRVKGISTILPLIKDLAHPAMKDRHWAALGRALNASLPSDPSSLTLGALLALRLDRCADACAEVVDTAKKEAVVEKALTKIESGWKVLTLGFTITNAPTTTPPCLVVDETVTEALESDGVTLQNLNASKAVSENPTFRSKVATWQKKLSNVDVVLSIWSDTQRKWTALEAIFCTSADIRAQLPEEATMFDQVNSDFKELMMAAPATPAVLDACAVPGRRERLEMLLRSLELRERALQDYLETKRQAFPRFYFVSTADLLDILAKGGDPHSVEHHLPKLFDNLHRLEWKKDEATGQRTNVAIGMYSGEGEYVIFDGECRCTGAVEVWLAAVVDAMRAALRAEYRAAMPAYEEKPRSKWVFDYSAQTTVLVSRTYFTQQVNDAFAELEGGNEDALKTLLERQKAQLSEIIELINSPLSKNDRKKLITLCTIDVHARDVVQRLIEDRCEAADVFAWQSQLRYTQDPKTGDPLVQICDADIPYQFEYIGNCGCLCITPLTDRCYITLTQAQRLILGGAPAGPAGTGKTETTKDLARALGVQCYVFNCSDQMDYKAMGQIYKGLAQTGAWGCFDEFNRIPVPVLSVCSTQYKAVLDALRSRQNHLLFEGNEIKLKNSAMAHITMNPGYIGRAELPESLKALFRPVSMAAPDLSLICEIMLMAEGFQAARALSRKFIALYRLCEDLLSKARHYDWKLRAIKTTLYVAGGMKRAAPELSEEKVLLRALRDFNLGKLTADDAAVFSGLLEDLFPKTSSLVPRAIDITFETRVREAALELGYQPEPVFLLKVSQLREIFEVRWSVFLLGPPGCGKTAVWKTLQRALQLSGHIAVAKVINPKSVTRDELYGCLHPQTREWKEGLLSATYRSMAAAHSSGAASGTSASTGHHQWIVLDGDIDPEWIESMNTVMDDNKMLTLASNERIALAPSMRLLLEISHMNHASPATVSRGGVIYMNAEDVGWRATADSWLSGHSSPELRAILTPLFDRYVEPTLEFVRRKCATIVPLPFVNQVETLCKLVEGLLQEEAHSTSTPSTTASANSINMDRKAVEARFVFASIWALGGCLTVDKVADHRAVFSTWWISEHKTIPFPVDTDCTVFDYFIDPKTNAWSHWKSLMPTFDFAAAVTAASCGGAGGDANSSSGAPLDPAALFVPTTETIRIQYLLKLLLKNGHSAMLVGGAGTGKTSTIKDLLKSLDSESYVTHILPLNSFHDGPTLQNALEAPLERKIGTRYGPPGTKKLIYFIDDANMPSKDKYDTQSALELLRQAIDSKGWYDKAKATSKEVSGVQFVASMNPTSGSFTLSGRLQRHFATFLVPAPAPETAVSMCMQLLQGHFASTIGGNWSEEMKRLASVLAEATVELHTAIVNTFIPSAVRFHYVFTLREVAAVVGGLLRMTPAAFCISDSSPDGRSRGGRNSRLTATAAQLLKAARLWSHECERVYADRLTSDGDLDTLEQLKASVIRRHFVPLGITAAAIDARPLLFSTFCSSQNGGVNGADSGGAGSDSHAATGARSPHFSIADDDANSLYDEIVSQDQLRRVLEFRLVEHNESNPAAAMDLVLFPQAAEHVVRVARVLAVPGGHVAMIGVGGSGKQSLARLAAHVAGCEVFQVQVTTGYGVNELKADLATLYQKCGAKSVNIAFIITDAHIVDERFLVYINELLATGQVADLIPAEEREALGAAVRAEVKASGGLDTPEACWAHILKKLRRNLHVVLCLSPAGERLRGLARRFPALVACVTYNWLRPWPRDALESVAERFLITEPALSGENNAGLRAAVAAHMASTHAAVEAACKQYLEQFRRYNYTTPKSFLELIGVYKETLQKTSAGLLASRERLEQGVDKISTAAAAVEGLRTALAAEKLVVAEKKAAAAALIESIGREKSIADEAVAASKGDEEAAATLTAQVLQVQTECTTDLAAAEPVIAAAEAALNSLDKASLGELKSFSNPAPEVVAVVAACMILTAPGGVIPKDLSWTGGKKWMGAQSLDTFLKSLTNFNKDNVPASCVERVEKDYLSQPTFKAEAIKVKSMAAAGLCAWVTNIAKYFRIYQVVAPKRAALVEANKKLADANRKLSGIRAHITELRARVGALEASLVAATAEKVAAEAQAEGTATKAALADRVIGGLGSEFQRWNAAIQTIKRKDETIIGDALLAAAFVSYAGAFNAQMRAHLVEVSWIPEAQRRGIPLSENPSPMNILCTSTTQASWAKEGLLGDRLSAENAGIVGATRRWPLLIDPQLHGARWVRGREGSKGLVILQQGAPKLVDAVIRCIENGTPLMIENLPESLDPALEPLVAKRTVKRGRSVMLTLGGREVALHPEFKLYLHTKLPNPHYGPEVAAQTTIVNFAVTPEGLEEQLLAAVVGHEAADLQAQAAALSAQLAEYTVTLEELEDGLLARLAASQGDILEDKPLVENLEATKATALEVADNVAKAKTAEIKLNVACEVYRPVAARGAMLYFFIDSLAALDRVYWYSMANFSRVMKRGMDAATPLVPSKTTTTGEEERRGSQAPVDLDARVGALISSVTESVFTYVTQGLFERHKPVAAAQLALETLKARSELTPAALDFLLCAPQASGKSKVAVEWLPSSIKATVLALEEVDGFRGLVEDLESSAKRWGEWYHLDRPEEENLPRDWRKLTALHKLLLVRAMRPDRLGPALSSFVAATLGPAFTHTASKNFDLELALQDAGPATPVLIFVSPGVDTATSVEEAAKKKGLIAAGNYASVSLGQGQEAPAMAKLRHAASHGGWVLLQNIHLTIEWTWAELDRAIDSLSATTGTTHPDFQLFLSAEPPPSLERPLPPSLLQSCVKLTNEPPQGICANLARAWAMFDDDILDSCVRPTEYRAIVFALCFFHAVLQERKKFGVGNSPGTRSGIGWNMAYPFSAGDLRCCGQLAANYLDTGAKIPWDDLRYLAGEIMYGGHVVELWDRRLVSAYLESLLSPALLETGKVCPELSLPPSGLNHAQTTQYILEKAPKDGGGPLGLHSNAERGVSLRAAGEICAALAALQSGGGATAAATGGSATVEERCKSAMEAILESLPSTISIEEVRAAAIAPSATGDQGQLENSPAPGPFAMVVLQECERMNIVLATIRTSLAEVALGLKGDLVMSESMDALATALAADRVPLSWAAVAYPSLRPLSSWIKNLISRHIQLSEWSSSPRTLPNTVWLPGLFNPASFLTAVQQVAARKGGYALDATVLVTEVTRKVQTQVDAPPREGAYIHGLYLEGARWEERTGCLEESRPKEMACALPVLHVKGVSAEKAAAPADAYACPVYTTEARFRQEVFTVQLKGGKQPARKWAQAGVALLLDIA